MSGGAYAAGAAGVSRVAFVNPAAPNVRERIALRGSRVIVWPH